MSENMILQFMSLEIEYCSLLHFVSFIFFEALTRFAKKYFDVAVSSSCSMRNGRITKRDFDYSCGLQESQLIF